MTPTTVRSQPPEAPAGPPIDWHTVLSKHDRWLRTVVHARLGEPAAVDDVMQEIALAAVRQKAPISDPSKVAPWLYRLAVLHTLLHRRKMGRSRNLLQRYSQRVAPHRNQAGSAPDPLDWLVARERQSLVQRAVQRLKSVDAEILMLKYSEDWNYTQIAQHLGISHSAVEARLHRARARLRQELAGFQFGETET